MRSPGHPHRHRRRSHRRRHSRRDHHHHALRTQLRARHRSRPTRRATSRFPAFLRAIYTAAAASPGFRSVRIERVALQAGKTRQLTLTLIIQVQQQQVTVNGDTIDSSPDKNGDAIIFKGSDLDALSDDPDELTQQLQMIAGSDPDAGTNFYIDGFSGGRLPPKNAIREIRMNQNPYSAQYDQIGFGRIEIFTKPGADTWHGDYFTQVNESNFNSRNPFVSTQPPYHSLELWGDLNGPLTKHSSEFTEIWHEGASDDSIVNAFVLDSSLNQTPFTQIFPNNSGETDFSTRYDLQAGQVHTLSARYHLSKNTQTNGGVGQFALSSQAYDSNNTEQTLQLSDSQAWSPKLLNETRFQYIRDRNRQTPQNFGPTIVVQGGFTGGGNNTGLNNDAQDHYELQNYAQSTRGKHTMAYGVRLRDTRDANTSTANFNGQYTFSSLAAYQITEQGIANGWSAAQIAAAGGGPSLFTQTKGTPGIVVNVYDMGLYAEDNYKIKPNVTLSYGLRFESQNRFRDHADFAPRLGASWALNGGKNKPPIAVLRSGFGLFYQRFPSLNVLQAQRQNGITEQEQVVNSPTFYPAVCSSNPAACAGAPTNAPTIFQVSPSIRAPYVMMASIGVDKPIGKIGQISTNYQFSRSVHSFLTRNINAPLPGTYNPADPTSGVRPLGTDQNIYQYESEGDATRHRLFVNANLHTKHVGIYTNYQLGKAELRYDRHRQFPLERLRPPRGLGPRFQRLSRSRISLAAGGTSGADSASIHSSSISRARRSTSCWGRTSTATISSTTAPPSPPISPAPASSTRSGARSTQRLSRDKLPSPGTTAQALTLWS
jgi:hypothetical protein